MILYRNQFIPKEELRISHEDRGYYFGDGVYEVFRVYGGRIFEKDAHLRRLERSAAAVKIRLPYPVDQIGRMTDELVARTALREGTVYLQITRGAAPRAHAFPTGAEPVLLAYGNPVPRPLETMRSGISAVTLDDIRWLRCDIKSLNLLPNVLAKQEAVDQGVHEAILHRDGIVTECSASNIMIVKDGQIRTHPADNLILHGVTRAFVLRLAEELGIPAAEEPFTVGELREADEIFITGTTVEVTPVIAIDGNPAGGGKPGPVTRKLQQLFETKITA